MFLRIRSEIPMFAKIGPEFQCLIGRGQNIPLFDWIGLEFQCLKR